MLTKYNETMLLLKTKKEELTCLVNEQFEIDSSLDNLKYIQFNENRAYNTAIKEEIDNILKEEINKGTLELDEIKGVLKTYQLKSNEAISFARGELARNYGIEYEKPSAEYTKTKNILNDVNKRLEYNLSTELVNVYKHTILPTRMNNEELDNIYKWLEYFKDYDCYENIMKKFSSTLNFKEKISEEMGDLTTYLLIIFIITAYFFRTAIALYLIFLTLATVYLRVREFYHLVQLASFTGFLESVKTEYENNRNEKIQNNIDQKEKKLYALKTNIDKVIDDVNKKLQSEYSNLEKIIKNNFDKEKAEKEAKERVQQIANDIEELITKEKIRLEEAERTVKEKEEEVNNVIKELEDLRNKIRSTYENLKPSFKETMLLKSFFLGFDDNNEPVTLPWSGEPMLMCLDNSKVEQYNALMDTIIMMCCQIMTTMSPLSYKINVVDIRTGGAQLSSFQVASSKDENAKSELFTTITTTQETSKLIDKMYEVYEGRRLKILGEFKDIDEFNKSKSDRDARTEYYIINILYEYDYKILSENEKMKQLLYIGHSVGIIFICALDTSRIESDTTKCEDKNKYKYRFEVVSKSDLSAFELYKFVIGESIDFVTFKEKELISKIRSNK